MLKLFFLVTWRNLLRDKLTSFIQLFGLVIGLACFIVIQLYVEHQKSYNQLFTDAGKTYRVKLFRDENKPQTLTPLRLAEALASNFNGIEDATRVSATSVSIKHQQQMFSERVLFVDNNYFRFFDFELLEGDRMTALDAPDALILHEDMAVKYFASKTGVLGKRLMINGQWHQVTGVVKKTTMPHTMPLTMLVPMERFLSILPSVDWGEMWNFNATITFVKIPDEGSITGLESSVSDYYDMRAEGLSSFKSYRVEFGPLLDIYLDDQTTLSLTPPGSDMMVKVFSFISMLILLLACVNFTNLSTSAALKEGKNVGVRKALGASKLQLVSEYLLQAILFTFFATVLAVGVVMLCLPAFNMLMNAEITFTLTAALALQLSVLAAVVGVLAGLYPAFFLSNLEAAHVLKGLVSSSKAGVGIRQALIVFQFGIADLLVSRQSHC